MTDDVDAAALWAVAASLMLTLLIVLATGWLLVYSAKQRMPVAVVMALSVLALVSLIGYIAGGEARPELAAIAGTAVGALAGATTGMLVGDRSQPEPEPPLEPNSGGD